MCCPHSSALPPLPVSQHFLRQQLPPAHSMQPYLCLSCLFKFHLDPQTNSSPREGLPHFGCVLQANEMCRRHLRCSFSSNLYQGPHEHDSQRLVLPLGLESSWTLPRDTGRTGECAGLSTWMLPSPPQQDRREMKMENLWVRIKKGDLLPTSWVKQI